MKRLTATQAFVKKAAEFELAKIIVSDILDKGLADSTWRDNNPSAYAELLEYRADMVESVRKSLVKGT